MTNLLASLAITLTTQTNWTGVTSQDKELGYIITNHIATVAYQDITNQYTVKTDLSDVAVWKDVPKPIWMTNSMVPVTNYFHFR